MTTEFGTGLATETLLDSDPAHPKLENLLGDEEPGLDKEKATFEDPEVEAILASVKEMDGELEKLKELHDKVEKKMKLSKEKMKVDARSIYVGNVDYSTTAEELEVHFRRFGSVNKVTILSHKYTGHPKGFAYIEFVKEESVRRAMALDQSVFKGRQLKVCAKWMKRPGDWMKVKI